MSNFEEARHQGFSQADMAQEEEEITKKMNSFGCHRCNWGMSFSLLCDVTLKSTSKMDECPFFKDRDTFEEERT